MSAEGEILVSKNKFIDTGFFYRSKLLFSIFTIIFIISCSGPYDKAKEYFDEGNLIEARKYANRISADSKMADSGKILLHKIDLIEDSIVNYNDSISFHAARQEYLSKSYEQAIKEINKINCKYIRPSVFCDSASSLKLIVNNEILKAKEEERVQNILDQIDREIASLKKTSYQEKTEPTEIQMAIVLLAAYQKILDDNRNETDKRVKSKLNVLGSLVKSNRISTLPKLRRDYAKMMRKMMWQHDMDVTYFGSGNKILQLTSYMFASNRGIQSIQDALKDTPRLLRYSQVRYKWYEGADEYTYYNLETPQDSDPFIIN